MRFASALIGLLALTAFLGCAHEEVAPAPVDPTGFDQAWRDFEGAWNELDLAIKATPRWETVPAMKVRVEGIAAIADERAGRLAAWNGPDLVNPAIISLLHADVRQKAMIDSLDLPLVGGDLLTETAPQLRSFTEERAWHRITTRLDLLEAYAATPLRPKWVENKIIAHDLRALETLAELSYADTINWQRLQVAESSYELIQERATAVRGQLAGDGAAPN